jgi:hypothetical protein
MILKIMDIIRFALAIIVALTMMVVLTTEIYNPERR